MKCDKLGTLTGRRTFDRNLMKIITSLVGKRKTPVHTSLAATLYLLLCVVDRGYPLITLVQFWQFETPLPPC